jgi:hypothetical protein
VVHASLSAVQGVVPSAPALPALPPAPPVPPVLLSSVPLSRSTPPEPPVEMPSTLLLPHPAMASIAQQTRAAVFVREFLTLYS